MQSIEQIMSRQRHFFAVGKTKEYDFRLRALLRLKQSIRNHKKELEKALYSDLKKSSFEGYMTEIAMVYEELSFALSNLKEWMRPAAVKTSLACTPAKSMILKEPYGVTLIMSPWNYPFLLTMAPLIGAIAAGNCCVVKPSAYSPEVSMVIGHILSDVFPKRYVAVVEGGRKENEALLEQHFDYIFFTGGVDVGRLVMEKASRHLTPVTLELGGKSPCIVDETADLALAAKRLVFGKFLNSGQTCVAPDYLLVQDTVKESFLDYVLYWTRKMYGNLPLSNEEYPKMVNEKHFDRVMALIRGEKVLIGGYGSKNRLQIAPTVLDNITADSPIMKEEIFGPVLPVLTFHSIYDAERFVLSREKPLALYLFSRDKIIWQRIINNISFGGGCINDTIMHLASPRLPFGGVGASGMGSYHGKASFDTFSHTKSLLIKRAHPDVNLRYHPYTGMKNLLAHMVLH